MKFVNQFGLKLSKIVVHFRIDAQFSKIFLNNYFKILSEQEKTFFETTVKAKRSCNQCESKILVNLISESDYPELDIH